MRSQDTVSAFGVLKNRADRECILPSGLQWPAILAGATLVQFASFADVNSGRDKHYTILSSPPACHRRSQPTQSWSFPLALSWFLDHRHAAVAHMTCPLPLHLTRLYVPVKNALLLRRSRGICTAFVRIDDHIPKPFLSHRRISPTGTQRSPYRFALRHGIFVLSSFHLSIQMRL